MRWKNSPAPKRGAERIRSWFAWIPVDVGSGEETRWLERVRVLQVFLGRARWHNWKFLAADENPKLSEGSDDPRPTPPPAPPPPPKKTPDGSKATFGSYDDVPVQPVPRDPVTGIPIVVTGGLPGGAHIKVTGYTTSASDFSQHFGFTNQGPWDGDPPAGAPVPR